MTHAQASPNFTFMPAVIKLTYADLFTLIMMIFRLMPLSFYAAMTAPGRADQYRHTPLFIGDDAQPREAGDNFAS